MIYVKPKYRKGVLYGFTIKGHAGYADAGQDIVCAAVSVLSLNTVNSIDRFTEDVFDLKTDEASGYMDFAFQKGSVSHDGQLLLRSFWLGVTEIAGAYQSFITIES